MKNTLSAEILTTESITLKLLFSICLYFIVCLLLFIFKLSFKKKLTKIVNFVEKFGQTFVSRVRDCVESVYLLVSLHFKLGFLQTKQKNRTKVLVFHFLVTQPSLPFPYSQSFILTSYAYLKSFCYKIKFLASLLLFFFCLLNFFCFLIF